MCTVYNSFMMPYTENQTYLNLTAMALGIAGTTLFHLSKCLQKMGITLFRHAVSARNDTAVPVKKKSLKAGAIYIGGLIINMMLPLLIMFSGRFAPPSYFTSMFGLGLIVLMAFSHKFLKEKVTKEQYAGTVILITGSVILGVENATRSTVSYIDMNLRMLLFLSAGYIASVLIILKPMKRNRSVILFSVSAGLLTGFTAAMDPVLKALSQNIAGDFSLSPSTAAGWAILAVSFISGFLSFLITQIAFAGGARITVLMPVHNSLIIAVPLVMEYLTIAGTEISVLSLLGLVLVSGGLFKTQSSTA